MRGLRCQTKLLLLPVLLVVFPTFSFCVSFVAFFIDDCNPVGDLDHDSMDNPGQQSRAPRVFS